jgi:hypothetical protein
MIRRHQAPAHSDLRRPLSALAAIHDLIFGKCFLQRSDTPVKPEYDITIRCDGQQSPRPLQRQSLLQ